MVRKAILHVCTLFVLVLLMGVAASAQTTPTPSTDSSKTTTTKKTTAYSSKTSTTKGQTCGGIAGLQCPEGQACRFPINQCNVADLAGVCVKVKATCPKGGAKVCGCDGTTYANECELLKANVHEAHKGACTAKM